MEKEHKYMETKKKEIRILLQACPNLIPPAGLYSELLSMAAAKYGVSIGAIREQYGCYTCVEWLTIL